MSLPTETIAFTGADGTALATYNSSFTVINGSLEIKSNQLGGSGNSVNNVAVWNADTFSDDQYAQATASTRSTGAGLFGVAVRITGPVGSLKGYAFRHEPSGGYAFLSRWSGGSGANVIPDGLGSVYLTAPTQGAVVKMTAETSGGNCVVKVYYDGVLQYTYTDTNPITGGAPGIFGWDNTISPAAVLIDNWSAGNTAGDIAAIAGNHARRRRV